MEYSILSFGFYLLIFIFLLYVVGHTLLSLLNIQSAGEHAKVFAKLTSGIFVIVFLYSIYKTSFQTISTGFIIAALLLCWVKNFRIPNLQKGYQLFKDTGIKTEFSILFQLYIIAILILSWNYYFIYSGGAIIPKMPHPDLAFFARVSSFFNIIGKEGVEMDYLNPQALGTTPYHYFELWVNAFISYIFDIKSTLLTIQLICIPTFLIIVISGIWSIMELLVINIFYKVFSITLLFITGFYLQIFENIPLYWTCYFQVCLFDQSTGLKTSVVLIGILIFILLINKKKYSEALGCLLLFPFASIFAMFTFVPSSIILSVYFLFRKKINFTSALKIIIATIITTIYFQLFYKLNADSKFHGNMVNMNTVIHQLSELSARSRIIIIVEKIIEIIILFSPIIILFPLLVNRLKFINKDSKALFIDTLIGLSIFILTSLISWNFFYFVNGSSEFFQVTTIGIINLCSCMLFYFIFLYHKNKAIRSSLILYLLILITFQVKKISDTNFIFNHYVSEKYSDEYINTINHSNFRKQGVSLLTSQITLSNINPFYYQHAPYLTYFKPEYGVINISIYEIPGGEKEIDKLAQTTFLYNSPFFKFIQLQKTNGEFKSITKSQHEFIDYYHIGYLIISKGYDLDSTYKKKLKLEIQDNKSGEKFWILK